MTKCCPLKNAKNMLNQKEEIEIYAFQGNRRLALRDQPLIATGHVGLSVDGNKIYGFGPIITKQMNLTEMYSKVREREAFSGQLTDDTELFKKVASGFYNKPDRKPLELYKLRVPIDSQTYLNILEEIKNKGRGYFYRLPKEDVPFPPKNYNCATFWGKCGVNLPHENGFLDSNESKSINK